MCVQLGDRSAGVWSQPLRIKERTTLLPEPHTHSCMETFIVSSSLCPASAVNSGGQKASCFPPQFSARHYGPVPVKQQLSCWLSCHVQFMLPHLCVFAVLYLPDFTSLNVDIQGCQGRAELMRKVPVLFLLVQVIISE